MASTGEEIDGTGSPGSPGWAWALVAAATVVAAGLRAPFVGDPSLGYEEVFTAAIVGHATPGGVWEAVRATESTPPLFYLLSWAWVHLVGSQGVATLRTISLLAGVATVPVSFAATRCFVSTRVAVAVAWLCAVSPILVGYSIYARSYALFVLVATASVWAVGALLARPSWARCLLWAVAATACLWTHYFGVYLLFAEVVVLFVRLREARSRLAVAVGAVGLAVLPLWSLFRAQSGASERTAYIAGRPLTGRVEGIVRELGMGTNVPYAWLEAAGLVLVVGAALAALVGTGRRVSTRVLVALAVGGGGLPILAAVTGVDDHLLPRNIAGIWVCLAALAAWGLTRLRGVPLVAYSAACVAAVVLAQTDWRYQAATDWRGASLRVRAVAAGAPVAVMPGYVIPVAELYLGRRPLAVPVATSDLWVMVEPARGAGQRALNPVADPPIGRLWGPGFRPVGEIDYRGFRMIHLRSPTPTVVGPAPAGDNGPPSAPLALVLAP
ncbi:MAG TPA: glycosyltransferase family 39 protein [Solirubrobacteraceae bacterium]|nr:glycosyltransferase family 39 protein [Solirubrobacteraceae bacterium]